MFTYQTTLMYYLIVDGPELSCKEIVEFVIRDSAEAKDVKQLRVSICNAAHVCRNKGWISKHKNGIYTLSAAGRKVWEPVLEKKLEGFAV